MRKNQKGCNIIKMDNKERNKENGKQDDINQSIDRSVFLFVVHLYFMLLLLCFGGMVIFVCSCLFSLCFGWVFCVYLCISITNVAYHTPESSLHRQVTQVVDV